MSAEQNVDTARQMYQAFGRGDVRAILDLVTDDVDWATDAPIASAPWYDPSHGKDGVAAFFEAMGKTGSGWNPFRRGGTERWPRARDSAGWHDDELGMESG